MSPHPRRARRLALALSLALAALPACAARTAAGPGLASLPKPSRELDFPGQAYMQRYDNGLTLFVVPDAFTRLVQFDVRQAVGSRDDPTGKYGLAHFVEHLMFQIPSEGPDSPPLMSTIPQHTLFFNAYTSNDETHYIHSGRSDDLETYFKYTALRLSYDCDAVPEREFMREREVVRQEIRWRRNDVDMTVFSRLLALAFPEGHPYRQDASGNDLQIASITPEDACAFIKRYYTAGQAIVVISGDVDPSAVKSLADRYLQPLPAITTPPRPQVAPPAFAAKSATVSAPVKKPSALILFPMPRRFTPEATIAGVAQETVLLAIAVLVGGRGSTVKEWGPAQLGGKEAQVFGISVETERARDLDRAVDEVLDAIVRAFRKDLKDKSKRAIYDSNRQRARLDLISEITNLQARAGAYADYLEEGDRPSFYRAPLAVIDDLTPDRVQEFGRQVFARELAMVVKVVPDGKADEAVLAPRANFDFKPRENEDHAVPADIDPEEASRPLPIAALTPREAQSVEYELESGMRVVLVRSTHMPVMDVQLIVGAGEVDAPGAPELAAIAARFYGARYEDRDAANIMQNFEFAGGIFRSRVDPLSTTFVTRGLSIYLDFILAGLSEQVVQAEYRTESLENWKQGRIDAFKKQSNAQAVRRQNTFYTALYGPGHPHVRELRVDRSEIRDLSLADLEAFRAAHYRAANSTLVLTGGFDLDLAIRYIEAYFGAVKLRDRRSTWKEPRVTDARTRPPEPQPQGPRVLAEFDKKAIQSDVTIAFPLAEIYGERHAALSVLAQMIDFEVSTVREQLGASYGISAGISADRPHLRVAGAVDSARAGEALAAILAAIQRVRGGVDFERRFAFARRQVVSRLLQSQGDTALLAGQLADAARNGLGYEYFEQHAAKVAALTPADIRAEIERTLAPARALTLLQGPEAAVRAAITANKLGEPMILPEVVHAEDET